MVIPYAAEGEDLRNVLEADFARRVAVNAAKEGFDRHEWATIDFVARLKSAKENRAFSWDSQSDVKSQIVQASGADVYVQVEAVIQRGDSGTAASVTLTAYEPSTGNALGSSAGFSGRFYTDDEGRLAQKAVDSVIDGFVETVDSRFAKMMSEGRAVMLEIGVGPDASRDLRAETSAGERLSDAIEEWVSTAALDGRYHLQGSTAKVLLFDEIFLPFRDKNGAQYTPNRFALDVSKIIKAAGFDVERDVKGSTVVMTLR